MAWQKSKNKETKQKIRSCDRKTQTKFRNETRNSRVFRLAAFEAIMKTAAAIGDRHRRHKRGCSCTKKRKNKNPATTTTYRCMSIQLSQQQSFLLATPHCMCSRSLCCGELLSVRQWQICCVVWRHGAARQHLTFRAQAFFPCTRIHLTDVIAKLATKDVLIMV